MMSSESPGKNTLKPEVTNISSHGFWLLSCGKEHFLSFDEFPWFRKILNIEEPCPGHFYWPELDVDISIGMIEHPENYPLSFE